jgi:glucose/arabinose dehydrogenase
MDKPDILDWVNKTAPPAWAFGAHWAPNGFAFLTSDALGPDYKGDAFVAFHGSWNSTTKVGYRVERILFDEVTGEPYGSQRIVSTLAADGRGVLGRPVDCVETKDGSVLFSDDQTRRVYRITAIAPAVSQGR